MCLFVCWSVWSLGVVRACILVGRACFLNWLHQQVNEHKKKQRICIRVSCLMSMPNQSWCYIIYSQHICFATDACINYTLSCRHLQTYTYTPPPIGHTLVICCNRNQLMTAHHPCLSVFAWTPAITTAISQKNSIRYSVDALLGSKAIMSCCIRYVMCCPAVLECYQHRKATLTVLRHCCTHHDGQSNAARQNLHTASAKPWLHEGMM